MKKKVLIIVVALILLVTVSVPVAIWVISIKSPSSNVEEEINYKTYETRTYVTEEMKSKAESSGAMVDLAHAYTPEYMLEVSDAVVIASIISVDYANTEENTAVGNTYGTMVVNNVLYGDMEQEVVLNYIKSGGIMTLEEYEKNQIPSAVEKREEMRAEAGVDASKIYLDLHFENDVDVSEGKVYLCYLHYIERLDMYEIVGIGEGFREVNIEQVATVTDEEIDTTGLKILNNETLEYESLDDYIENNINNLIK